MPETTCPCGIRAAAHLCDRTGMVHKDPNHNHRAAQVRYEDARYFPYYDDDREV
jgi:hypothetical protein